MGDVLPSSGFGTVIGIIGGKWAAGGSVQYFSRGRIVNFVAHGIANVLGDACNVSNGFTRIGRETRIGGFKIHLFPKGESKEYTDINGDSCQCGKRDVAKRFIPEVVQNKADITEAEEPS